MCIWIVNYQPGDVVHQPLIQLLGLDSFYHDTLLVNEKQHWPVLQGLFKIYVELVPGENLIHLSTPRSKLTITLIHSPPSTVGLTLRLIDVALSDLSHDNVEHRCKQLLFLTKLVRCTFDELLFKQFGYRRALTFDIERPIHHVPVSKDHFHDHDTDEETFKEIYRQVHATDLVQDASVKLIIRSSIAPSRIFAYTFSNTVVLNLTDRFTDVPVSLQQFHDILSTSKVESVFYLIGAYLHELGHVLGLDHGNGASQSIMSSSKGYIDAGWDFLLVSPRLCSLLYDRQCSCYREPLMNVSSSYSNGLLCKHSDKLNSSCKSDIHCSCPLKFNRRDSDSGPHQCQCNGQFQFDVAHCQQLVDRLARPSESTAPPEANVDKRTY